MRRAWNRHQLLFTPRRWAGCSQSSATPWGHSDKRFFPLVLPTSTILSVLVLIELGRIGWAEFGVDIVGGLGRGSEFGLSKGLSLEFNAETRAGFADPEAEFNAEFNAETSAEVGVEFGAEVGSGSYSKFDLGSGSGFKPEFISKVGTRFDPTPGVGFGVGLDTGFDKVSEVTEPSDRWSCTCLRCKTRSISSSSSSRRNS